MKSLQDTFTLRNGVKIPCVGFGTWKAADGQVCVQAVRDALELGYRHIDTAAAYGNEESVGRAIRESGIAREELFVTTKLANPVRGYEETLAAFDQSMKRLGLDVLDLYLVHWPAPAAHRHDWKHLNAESWRAMEKLYQDGRIRALGVSNFLPHHLDALMETAQVMPMVNQLRLCPGETQAATAAWCAPRGVLLEAYSPLGSGKIFDVPEVQALAAKYGRTIAQICLCWSLQNGWLPLPKSVTAARIRENADIFDFELSDEDMEFLAGLTDCCGPTANPDTVGF